MMTSVVKYGLFFLGKYDNVQQMNKLYWLWQWMCLLYQPNNVFNSSSSSSSSLEDLKKQQQIHSPVTTEYEHHTTPSVTATKQICFTKV